ncbi:hypothetical protein GCM10017764_09650 [Sphingobacterium griseoflavum]|uniref:Beta-lactamase-related domain-containing protein n=2 Tax=Sphingobacterium griseoflavum TaxID=1474952 RepID=A0ABQ3HWY4_9SPHI|nr:hypothetical protein GCM10017764_09650 [Sphingobacterium griseoflavum]
MPGLMISIVKKDSILFSGGLGYADLEKRTPVDRITQFHLASITKFFVAMGIQKLIAEGKLNLNDPLQKSVPEISYTNNWESTNPVRIVHLLEHTAGFEDIHLNKMVNTTGKPLTGIAAIEEIENSLNCRWKPGKIMSYSNPGYNVLGYVMEKVSGIPWDQYINQTLLKPLEMDHTLFDLSGESLPTYAKGYDYRNGRFTVFPNYIPGSNGASSALVSNASDMAKFLHYLLNTTKKNGNDPLSERDIAEMEKIHSTLASQNGLQTGYALGNDFFPNNKKVTFRGHNGKGEGFSSWIFFNREVGLAYAISTNCNANLWPVSQVIEDFLTTDLEPPMMNSVIIDRAKIEPLLGYYQFINPKNERWEFHKRVFGGINLLAIENDKLVVDKGNGQLDSLIHMGNCLFRSRGNIIPSYIIGSDDNGRPFFQGDGNNFYVRTSYGPILFQKILIYLGLFAAVMSIIYTLVGIPLVLFRKIKSIDLCIACSPALGTICFLLAYRKMGLTDAINKELFTTLNTTSFSIFAGMLFFGIGVLIGAYLLCKRWPKMQKSIKLPLAFNSIFLLYLVVLLSIHGWIGIPIWRM